MSEIDRDTQDWLDMLSGQERPEADPKTVQEAEALREALLARQEPVPLKSATLDKVLTRLAEQDEADRKAFLAKRNYAFSIAASVVVGVLIGWPLQPLISSRTEDKEPSKVAQTTNSLIPKGDVPQREESSCSERFSRMTQVLVALEQWGLKENQLASKVWCEPAISKARLEVTITGLSSTKRTELEGYLNKQFPDQLNVDNNDEKKVLTIKIN